MPRERKQLLARRVAEHYFCKRSNGVPAAEIADRLRGFLPTR